MDPQLELLFRFFERLHRKGPGSETTTRRAYSMLSGLRAEPDIVEFGCGSGAASLVLADAGARVTAVDVYQPFLDDLMNRADSRGCADRITVACCDMADPPFGDQSFDVVWSEGAVYLMGLEQGARRWRSLLRPNGFLAVSDAVWLVDDPPQRAVDFWNAEGVGIETIAGNRTILEDVGYSVVGDFVIPASDWSDYYGPLQKELEAFRSKERDPVAQEFVDSMQLELDLWRDCGDAYGYVFLVAQRA